MINGLILGLQFLTRLPVNVNVDFNEDNMKRAIFFFPFIGLLLGFIVYVPYSFLRSYNVEIASLIAVLMMLLLTGGLHLDGLSDMYDGFLSSRDKERTLEIMKDSRIGAFGVISLIIALLSKFILFKNVESYPLEVIIFSMGNARLSSLLMISFKKMARPGGMGDMIHRSSSKKFVWSSIIIYSLMVFIRKPIFIVPLIVSILAEEIIARASYKKIDGVTGDIYGATIEIVEIVSLLSFIVVIEWI